MAKTDAELGQKVKAHLLSLGLETQVTELYDTEQATVALRGGIAEFMECLGLDVDNDDSIQETPSRVAEMFTYELCAGLNYNDFPKCTVTSNGKAAIDQLALDEFIDYRMKSWEGNKTREEVIASETVQDYIAENTKYIGKVDEMVMVRKIQTVSLCEHHFQTIRGHTYIAYIPGDKLLGVSKFARVTNFFARRPQVQERMTEQVYAALSFILGIEDIAVYQVASHNCMRARGAMEPESDMITSKMGGRFMTNQALRQEFLNAIPN